jgi:hypothetical protein
LTGTGFLNCAGYSTALGGEQVFFDYGATSTGAEELEAATATFVSNTEITVASSPAPPADVDLLTPGVGNVIIGSSDSYLLTTTTPWTLVDYEAPTSANQFTY